MKEGIIRRAIQAGKISVNIHDIRDFAEDKHTMTDDRPFGGGEGMVMKPEPIVGALRHVEKIQPGGRVVLLSPQGRTYTQETAERLSHNEHLVFLCGRYEGVDERIRAKYVFLCGRYEGVDERIRAKYIDEEISIGDYILTGGELPAMVLVDSITRLLPGVLGCGDSAINDTFSR
jgi:tRNA (guanine37-N1)-methyltransferase